MLWQGSSGEEISVPLPAFPCPQPLGGLSPSPGLTLESAQVPAIPNSGTQQQGPVYITTAKKGLWGQKFFAILYYR